MLLSAAGLLADLALLSISCICSVKVLLRLRLHGLWVYWLGWAFGRLGMHVSACLTGGWQGAFGALIVCKSKLNGCNV